MNSSIRSGAGRAGFTLLEVVLAMTALAMLTVVCYGAFHLGIRAVQSGGDGHPVLARVVLGGALHPGIGHQPVDERLAARALERADADAQPLADLVDHLVGRVHDHPAQRRHQHVLVERPGREQRARDREPQRDRYALGNALA